MSPSKVLCHCGVHTRQRVCSRTGVKVIGSSIKWIETIQPTHGWTLSVCGDRTILSGTIHTMRIEHCVQPIVFNNSNITRFHKSHFTELTRWISIVGCITQSIKTSIITLNSTSVLIKWLLSGHMAMFRYLRGWNCFLMFIITHNKAWQEIHCSPVSIRAWGLLNYF